jgi:hypothetical protein
MNQICVHFNNYLFPGKTYQNTSYFFKQLGPGQMVIVDKLPEFHVDLVQVWNPSEEKKAEVYFDQAPWPIKTLGSQNVQLKKVALQK